MTSANEPAATCDQSKDSAASADPPTVDRRANGGQRIAGVVLAAGAGSRFHASVKQRIEQRVERRTNEKGPNADDGDGLVSPGSEHKLLADFRGRPLVEWAIAAAYGADFDRLYVVAGAANVTAVAGAASNHTAAILDNPNWESGQATSLAVALDAAASDGCDAVVVGLGDQPLITSATWRAVSRDPGPIAVASFDGQRRPPVKLVRSVWAEVPRVGDEGARNLIRVRSELVSEVPCIDNPVDIDTLEDLDQWN